MIYIWLTNKGTAMKTMDKQRDVKAWRGFNHQRKHLVKVKLLV